MNDAGEDALEEEEEVMSSEDEGDAEMVIEQPFGYGDEQVGALLDLSNAEEAPRNNHSHFALHSLDSNLEPISLDNILPEGSRRRTRPTSFQ